jgi:hypothetical protein
MNKFGKTACVGVLAASFAYCASEGDTIDAGINPLFSGWMGIFAGLPGAAVMSSLVPAMVAAQNEKERFCLPLSLEATRFQKSDRNGLINGYTLAMIARDIAEKARDERGAALGVNPEKLTVLFDLADETKDRQVFIGGDKTVSVPPRAAVDVTPFLKGSQICIAKWDVENALDILESGVVDSPKVIEEIKAAWTARIMDGSAFQLHL